jgi:hypothetical protein
MLHVWFGIIPGGVQHLTHAVRRRPKGTLLFAICRGKKSRREGGKQLREMVFLCPISVQSQTGSSYVTRQRWSETNGSGQLGLLGEDIVFATWNVPHAAN